MSNSETVSLTLHDVPNDATLTVYDGQDRPVALARYGQELTASLPPGLYNVRVTRFGRIAEQVVRLAKPCRVKPDVPAWYTSAPLDGAASSHEYYSYTAAAFSLKDTRPPIGPDPDGRLFVFVRALDADAARGLSADLGASLVLRDAEGRVVARLDPSETAHDTTYGWVAFSVQAAPGFYALHETSAGGREAALHVFRGWQTQVFILHHTAPRLETMRIFLGGIGQGFHPADREAGAIDLALGALHAGVHSLPEDQLHILLSGKFTNPMFGIVGAHILLQQWQRGPSSRRDPGLLEMVLGNLEGLVPGSADVAALRLLAGPLLGTRPVGLAFRHPPMLRAGLAAVVSESALEPTLVPEEGVVDDIATRVLADSPWATWTPLGAAWPANIGVLDAKRADVVCAVEEAAPPQPERVTFNVLDVGSPGEVRFDLDVDARDESDFTRSRRGVGMGPTGERDQATGAGHRSRTRMLKDADRLDLRVPQPPAGGRPRRTTIRAPRPSRTVAPVRRADAGASAPAEPVTPEAVQDDWVHVALLDAAVRAGRAASRGRLALNRGEGVGWMAQQLGVTPRVVRRTAASLLLRPAGDLSQAIQGATRAPALESVDEASVLQVIQDLGRVEQ